MLNSTLSVLLVAAALFAAPAAGQAQQKPPAADRDATPTQPARSGYVEAGGVRYYYEIHGEGEPLLLLHGGLGSIDMFGPLLPALTKQRQVIVVDLHGHGRTALGDRPIGLSAMGADMAAILTELGYSVVDVLGYSMGGGVAAQLAVQHPERVRRLVMVSAPAAKNGFYPEIIEQMHQIGAPMAEAMRDTPMFRSYAAVAPHVEDFPKLLDALGEMMRRPDIYAVHVEALNMPVMLVYGDSDMYRPEHIVKFYQLLGGGLRDAGWQREHMSQNRLAILPGLTHYDIFLAPELVETVLPFLNGERRSADWADQVGK